MKTDVGVAIVTLQKEEDDEDDAKWKEVAVWARRLLLFGSKSSPWADLFAFSDYTGEGSGGDA